MSLIVWFGESRKLAAILVADLAAILVADVVGYSARWRASGDLIDPAIAAHRGRVGLGANYWRAFRQRPISDDEIRREMEKGR